MLGHLVTCVDVAADCRKGCVLPDLECVLLGIGGEPIVFQSPMEVDTHHLFYADFIRTRDHAIHRLEAPVTTSDAPVTTSFLLLLVRHLLLLAMHLLLLVLPLGPRDFTKVPRAS